MKIFKYLIFISILSGIFFVIYRKSDKKGFRRWWVSFRTAVLIAASAAGLISNPAGASETYIPSNPSSTSIERVVEPPHLPTGKGQSKFGPGALENNDRQIIMVKRGDSVPSVPNAPGRGQPNNFPVAPPSRPVSGVNPYPRLPKVVNQGLGGAPNPAGAGNGADSYEEQDSCPAPKKEQSKKSRTHHHDFTQKSKKKKKQSQLDELAKPDLTLDAKQKLLKNPQLLELSIDPRNGTIDKQSFDEAESILQAKRETGLFDDERRPNSQKGEPDIDFIVSGAHYDEADVKTPKSFFDSKKGPKKTIPQDRLDYFARESGAKSIRQKKGSKRCLHILDLKDILPHQKKAYEANFFQGAREADPELAKHIIVQND